MFDCLQSRPIIILSTPRTGSTILGSDIAKYYNIKFYDEIVTKENSLVKLDEFYKQNLFNKDYVLKVHIYHLFEKFNDDLLKKIKYKKCSLVKIQRKTLIDQLVSYYIANNRDKWIYETNDNLNDVIPINHHAMLDNYSYINFSNNFLNSLQLNFDLTLTYEDCKFSEDLKQTPKPINYDSICRLAESVTRNKEPKSFNYFQEKFKTRWENI